MRKARASACGLPIGSIVKDSAVHWWKDDISIHGAALAFYTVFSVAPLLVISVAIAGIFFGPDAGRGEVFSAIRDIVGAQATAMIQGLVSNAAARPHLGKVATVAGAVTLLVGASGVFQQLQQSLNLIWGVTTRPGKGLRVFIRRRLLTFSMVLVIGFILLVTLLVSAAISILAWFLDGHLPGGQLLWRVVHWTTSIGVTVLLFGAVLKILPDVILSWRDVLPGALVASFLFSVGKFLIGLYLGLGTLTSSYGAAGSLAAVLLWVYFASQVFLFGAEFTRAYASYRGIEIRAKPGSVLATSGGGEKPRLAA